MKNLHIQIKAALLSIVFFLLFIGIWHQMTVVEQVDQVIYTISSEERAQLEAEGMASTDADYYLSQGLTFPQILQLAQLKLTREEVEMSGGIGAFGLTTDGGGAEIAESNFPNPWRVAKAGWAMVSDPFYDKGPNDKGIAIQLGYSLRRVALGFGLAVLVAIPLGFILGMSPLFNAALMPYIQILKPISPLAWMPLALYTIKDAEQSSIFVIFICSIWPMLMNTAFGVAGIRKELVNIGRTLELSRIRMAYSIILPAAAPTIVTGMRISIGIAWLVIVAAEMLIGGTGMGYFVWNEWNGLNIDTMIIAIVLIGLVGFFLDWLICLLLKKFNYQD